MDNRENRIPGSPRSQSAGWHMNGGSRTEPKSAGEAGAARASGDAGNCGAIRVPEECAADAVLREYHRLEWEMTPLAGMQAARAFALLQVLSACAFEQAYGIRADRLLKGRSVVSGQGAEVDTQVLNQAARYEQTPMSDEAHASLERDVQNFGAEVDRIVAVGKPPSQQVKMLGQAPLVLQLVVDPKTALGKAVAQGGLYASPHVFGGKHPNITPDILKKIPAAMVDPIAI
ncbi:MAG: hypothetical protein Q4F72_02835, partial [Desulfovibrionaceae bacterium]|nr:hypothetical protein [Desulfovibrionaceae bacterium]